MRDMFVCFLLPQKTAETLEEIIALHVNTAINEHVTLQTGRSAPVVSFSVRF